MSTCTRGGGGGGTPLSSHARKASVSLISSRIRSSSPVLGATPGGAPGRAPGGEALASAPVYCGRPRGSAARTSGSAAAAGSCWLPGGASVARGSTGLSGALRRRECSRSPAGACSVGAIEKDSTAAGPRALPGLSSPAPRRIGTVAPWSE